MNRMQAEDGGDFPEFIQLLDPPRQKVIQVAIQYPLELGQDFGLAGNVDLRDSSHYASPYTAAKVRQQLLLKW